MRRLPVLTCLFAALGTAASLYATDIQLTGDANAWRIAGDDTDGAVRTLELLRPGRNFGNSPEILVIERAPGDDASTAAESYLADKSSACEAGHYEFAFSGWEDTAYRWQPRGCDAPDAELEEVGRVVVSGNEVVRITVRLRDTSRVSFWSRWMSGPDATYASWRGSVFGGGSSTARRPSRQSASLSPDSCADDDLDCLLALQRRQVAELQDTVRNIGADDSRPTRSSRTGRSSSSDSTSSSAGSSSDACCAVAAIRSLNLQKANPAAERTEDVTRFLSTDTYVYLVADLRGEQGGSVVTFRWVKLTPDGDERPLVSRDVTIERGNTWVYGSYFYNGLTPVGRYRVYVYFDGELAGSRDFSVAAGSAFG